MQNCWKIDAGSVNGDVVAARMNQLLAVLIIQDSLHDNPQKEGLQRIDKMRVERLCERFGISRQKYYGLIGSDVDVGLRLSSGLLKFNDFFNLTRRLNIGLSTITRAAEESANIREGVELVCKVSGRPLPPFIDNLDRITQSAASMTN